VDLRALKTSQDYLRRCQFVGFADFVIHPGVGFEIAEFMPGGLSPVDIELRCSFAAENFPLEDRTIIIPN